MLELFVVFLAVAVGSIGLGLFLVAVSRRIKSGKGQHAFGGLGPSDFRSTLRAVGAQEVSGELLLERDEGIYGFKYISNSEGADSIQIFRVIKPGSGPGLLPELPVMNLRLENDRDRLGKSLRLNRELQTGDELFDARVYIECDDRSGAAKRMLSSPEVRKGITGLLSLGFGYVAFRLNSRALVTTWSVGARPFNRNLVEGAVERLSQIGSNLPKFRKVPTTTPISPGAWAVVLFWLVAMASLFFFFAADEHWPVLGKGLDQLTVMIALALFSVQAMVLWLMIRGYSKALRHLCWAILSGFMLAPTLSRGALLVANGSGDTALTTYERALQHKREVKGDDSTSYYFYFESVPGVEASSIKLSVSSSQYRSSSIGDMWQLTVGAGNLSTPWLLEMSRL